MDINVILYVLHPVTISYYPVFLNIESMLQKKICYSFLEICFTLDAYKIKTNMLFPLSI